jgi:hypothetical protein
MLEGLTPPVNNFLCLVGQKRLELSEEDKQVLDSSFEDPRWASSVLRRALIERGFVVGETVMLKHRKKECSCARESK